MTQQGETPLPPIDSAQVRGAQVLMGCDDLAPTLAFFVDQLGFRVDAIFPADDPRTAMISGYGLSLRLDRGTQGGVDAIHLLCDDELLARSDRREWTAPNGVRVKLVAADPPMRLPDTVQALVVTRSSDAAHWAHGRAGLRYRDLLPQRQGGAFIASHIRIEDGGPVPDYVHFHKIRFQMIFCRRGWVRVVYENQGEPFTMVAGDCVLQPPLIRHRVLESSAGAEVIEIGAPAEHITMADHQLELPQREVRTDRGFSGQRFVRHVAALAPWKPWRVGGFETQDTGIAEATAGSADVRVWRRSGQAGNELQRQSHEFCFYYVLSGSMTVLLGEQQQALAEDDCITLPADSTYRFSGLSDDLSLLAVTLPADSTAFRGNPIFSGRFTVRYLASGAWRSYP